MADHSESAASTSASILGDHRVSALENDPSKQILSAPKKRKNHRSKLKLSALQRLQRMFDLKTRKTCSSCISKRSSWACRKCDRTLPGGKWADVGLPAEDRPDSLFGRFRWMVDAPKPTYEYLDDVYDWALDVLSVQAELKRLREAYPRKYKKTAWIPTIRGWKWADVRMTGEDQDDSIFGLVRRLSAVGVIDEEASDYSAAIARNLVFFWAIGRSKPLGSLPGLEGLLAHHNTFGCVHIEEDTPLLGTFEVIEPSTQSVQSAKSSSFVGESLIDKTDIDADLSEAETEIDWPTRASTRGSVQSLDRGVKSSLSVNRQGSTIEESIVKPVDILTTPKSGLLQKPSKIVQTSSQLHHQTSPDEDKIARVVDNLTAEIEPYQATETRLTKNARARMARKAKQQAASEQANEDRIRKKQEQDEKKRLKAEQRKLTFERNAELQRQTRLLDEEIHTLSRIEVSDITEHDGSPSSTSISDNASVIDDTGESETSFERPLSRLVSTTAEDPVQMLENLAFYPDREICPADTAPARPKPTPTPSPICPPRQPLPFPIPAQPQNPQDTPVSHLTPLTHSSLHLAAELLPTSLFTLIQKLTTLNALTQADHSEINSTISLLSRQWYEATDGQPQLLKHQNIANTLNGSWRWADIDLAAEDLEDSIMGACRTLIKLGHRRERDAKALRNLGVRLAKRWFVVDSEGEGDVVSVADGIAGSYQTSSASYQQPSPAFGKEENGARRSPERPRMDKQRTYDDLMRRLEQIVKLGV